MTRPERLPVEPSPARVVLDRAALRNLAGVVLIVIGYAGVHVCARQLAGSAGTWSVLLVTAALAVVLGARLANDGPSDVEAARRGHRG